MEKFDKISALLSFIIVLVLLFSGCDGIFNNNPLPEPETSFGDTLWVHDKPILENTTYIRAMPLAIGKDGSVYYLADGGMATWDATRVYAINKDDGSLRWKTDALAIWHPNSNIVVADDGTVYVLSYTKLYSIDPNSGLTNWEWEVPEHIMHDGNEVYSYGEVGGLALANNGDLIFKTNGSGSYYRAMYCVDNQGNTKWYRVIGAQGTNITIGSTGTIFDYEYAENIKYLLRSVVSCILN